MRAVPNRASHDKRDHSLYSLFGPYKDRRNQSPALRYLYWNGINVVKHKVMSHLNKSGVEQ